MTMTSALILTGDEPAAEKARDERLCRVRLGRLVALRLAALHPGHHADQVFENRKRS